MDHSIFLSMAGRTSYVQSRKGSCGDGGGGGGEGKGGADIAEARRNSYAAGNLIFYLKLRFKQVK